MGFVSVEKLKQGLVLAANVHDVNHRLLLSKGQKIDQQHIRILKIWGVLSVSVVGSGKDDEDPVTPIDAAAAGRIRDALNLLYRHADLNHPILKEIYKNALIHRLKGTFGSLPDPSRQAHPGGQNFPRPEKIDRRIDKTDLKLPDAPTIITELNQVIADPRTTSNDVAREVNKSPSLAAMLLKIVNSAYYGFPAKIDRLTRAVTIIGTKEISGLALGISVMQAFKDIPQEVLNMNAFIRHSLACGMISRILAAQNNMAQTEQLFVSGLLHDIGKLIVHKYYPDHARACMDRGLSNDSAIFSTEKAIIGMNHAQIARRLLEKWNLPPELATNVIHHHSPDRAPNAKKAGIVHLADIITHGLGIGRSGERTIPHVDHAVVEAIVDSTDSIKMVTRQIVHQFAPLNAIFNG
ncbi:MAG TPA: HDOD domain-containing protein [Desulfosarcina sp.]|nr:HDOD domain-containing protein [Desulfosarcina sp.]